MDIKTTQQLAQAMFDQDVDAVRAIVSAKDSVSVSFFHVFLKGVWDAYGNYDDAGNLVPFDPKKQSQILAMLLQKNELSFSTMHPFMTLCVSLNRQDLFDEFYFVLHPHYDSDQDIDLANDRWREMIEMAQSHRTQNILSVHVEQEHASASSSSMKKM